MKRITDIDPNFRLPSDVPSDFIFRDARFAPFRTFGVAENEPGVLSRLPVDMLGVCNDGVQELAWHLAGACVRFSTDADRIAILWELTVTGNMPHFAASGQSGLELYEETDEGIFHVKNIIPAMNDGHGCHARQSYTTPLPGGMRNYVLYLPLYNGLKELQIGLPERAALGSGRTPKIEKPVLFYGSSITQGGCASQSGAAYGTILARRLDFAQINLGFSGSGRGEDHMAEYIASLPLSAFVMDYDHNAPTIEHLEATHSRFFGIIRRAQPDLPIIIMSKPDFHNGREANVIRREIIRKTYDDAKAAGDQNVWFVDGESYFPESIRDLCTVDGCHPTDLGFLMMANTLEPLLRGILYGA